MLAAVPPPLDGLVTPGTVAIPSDRVVLVGVLVGIGVAVTPVWHWMRHIVTAVHELGHAIVTLLLGGRVSQVHLAYDTSGWARSSFGKGVLWKPRMAVVAGAGYPAPSWVAVAGAELAATGRVTWFLWGWCAVAGAAMVLWVRNWWGVVVLAAVMGATYLVVDRPDAWPATLSVVLVWWCALGGLRAAAEHLRATRGRQKTDARLMQDTVWLPWPVTTGAMVLFALGVVWWVTVRMGVDLPEALMP